MDSKASFGEVLKAVDRLSLEDQEQPLVIVRPRPAERGRKRLAQDIREASEEFARGDCGPATADELMKEILN